MMRACAKRQTLRWINEGEVVRMDVEANASLLKKKGLKITAPRLAVLDIFQNSKERHLSAEDVYKEALAKDGDLGLATVYRVLTQLSEVGLLAATNFETGKTTFELNEGGHHDHLVCLRCGLVIEFNDQDIENRQEGIAKQHGFRLINHSMALYGVCSKPECNDAT
jgi:Fur family ferric uptake transcriptional regulator